MPMSFAFFLCELGRALLMIREELWGYRNKYYNNNNDNNNDSSIQHYRVSGLECESRTFTLSADRRTTT